MRPLPVEATADLGATPERVWDVLGDPVRMSELSPELRKVLVVGRGADRGRRVGSLLVGINRRGPMVWPTRSRISRYEPGRAIAWKTLESGATWVYELEALEGGRSTRVTGRRVLPAYTTASNLMTPLLGGAHGHDRELADGIATTLERLRALVES